MLSRRFLAQSATILGMLALAPTLSWATPLLKDYCIDFTAATNPYVQVGKLFIIPINNTCLPWIGFTPQNDLNSPSTGVGCTSADGTQFTLTLTTLEGGIYIFDSVTLDTSNGRHGPLEGTATEIQPDIDDGNSFQGPVTTMRCNVDIPAGDTGSFTPPAVQALIRSGATEFGMAPPQ
jgi:hypothetical protein